MNGTLDTLIRHLAALPGLGRRSAKRIALHLLTQKEGKLAPLMQALQDAAARLTTCTQCGNLDEGALCHICRDPVRQTGQLCVVADVADLWAVERARVFKGRYHVLGGVLSALDNVAPKDLRIDSLPARIDAEQISEVILALSVTVDGQSTAHYLQDMLKHNDVGITRLAHGVPVGGELNYLDDGTIAAALKSRAQVR